MEDGALFAPIVDWAATTIGEHKNTLIVDGATSERNVSADSAGGEKLLQGND